MNRISYQMWSHVCGLPFLLNATIKRNSLKFRCKIDIKKNNNWQNLNIQIFVLLLKWHIGTRKNLTFYSELCSIDIADASNLLLFNLLNVPVINYFSTHLFIFFASFPHTDALNFFVEVRHKLSEGRYLWTKKESKPYACCFYIKEEQILPIKWKVCNSI